MPIKPRLALATNGLPPTNPPRKLTAYRVGLVISSAFEGPEVQVLAETARFENGESRRKLPQLERPSTDAHLNLWSDESKQVREIVIRFLATPAYGLRPAHYALEICPHVFTVAIPPHAKSYTPYDEFQYVWCHIKLEVKSQRLGQDDLHQWYPPPALLEVLQSYRRESAEHAMGIFGLTPGNVRQLVPRGAS